MLLRWTLYRMDQTNQHPQNFFMLRVPLSWSLNFSLGDFNEPTLLLLVILKIPSASTQFSLGLDFLHQSYWQTPAFPLDLSLSIFPFLEFHVWFLPIQLETMTPKIIMPPAFYFSFTYQEYRFLFCGSSFLVDCKLHVNRKFTYLVHLGSSTQHRFVRLVSDALRMEKAY